MNKQIIALCGYPGVGKDEVARHLVEHHDFTRIAFAEPLREALLKLDPFIYTGRAQLPFQSLTDLIRMYGWTLAKQRFPGVRRMLQRIGTEVGREMFGQDCWTKIASKNIRDAPAHRIVITDMRFPNEEALVRRQSAKSMVIHVTRPGHGKVNEHASEQMDYAAVCDGTIANNGTVEDLQLAVDDVVSQWL